ncbi:hypothetical protein GGI42DRAFT_327517 [Trichoderma sp. SZMC 28013]
MAAFELLLLSAPSECKYKYMHAIRRRCKGHLVLGTISKHVTMKYRYLYLYILLCCHSGVRTAAISTYYCLQPQDALDCIYSLTKRSLSSRLLPHASSPVGAATDHVHWANVHLILKSMDQLHGCHKSGITCDAAATGEPVTSMRFVDACSWAAR